MKFSIEDIEIGNRLITDFMGISIEDKSDERGSWFTGTCWYPYKDKKTWSCSTKDEERTRTFLYAGKHFHKDWNWLMPVYEKICTLYIDEFPINCYIGSNGIYIGINPTNASGQEYKGQQQIVETLNINYLELDQPYTLIEGVWLGIVNFLKWYNQRETIT